MTKNEAEIQKKVDHDEFKKKIKKTKKKLNEKVATNNCFEENNETLFIRSRT